jgi:hypothetical protein
MNERLQEYRERLLAILAKLDQMPGDAEWVQAGPTYQEVVQAEDLREDLIELQSLVAEKLRWRRSVYASIGFCKMRICRELNY